MSTEDSFHRSKGGRSVILTSHLHLSLRTRIRGSLPPGLLQRHPCVVLCVGTKFASVAITFHVRCAHIADYAYDDPISDPNGSSVSKVTTLRAGRPWFDSRKGEGFFFPLRHRVQNEFGAHSAAAYPMGTGSKEAGVMNLTTHLQLMSGLRMRAIIPPPPPHVFMAWCLVEHGKGVLLS
jgi:hypothetical protein